MKIFDEFENEEIHDYEVDQDISDDNFDITYDEITEDEFDEIDLFEEDES